MRATHNLYLIQVTIKLHEDTMNGLYKIIITQNKPKTQSKDHNSETKSKRKCRRHIVLT